MGDEQQEQKEILQPDSCPRRGNGKAVAALLLLAVAASLAVYSYRLSFRATKPELTETEADVSEAQPAPEPAGSPEAKLHIEACLGHCISPIMNWLAECAKAWPDKVRGEFYAYESVEGQKFLEGHGESLGSIFFNGKNEFVIEKDGKKRKVCFRGPPGEEYRIEDLVTVLRMQLEKLYGDVPDDFDEVAKKLEEHWPSGD